MYGLGWPGVFIWAILFPISFFLVVYNAAKKNNLDNYFFKSSWGFFYNEYSKDCYYWEFIKIAQKELMIIILIFFSDDVIVKVFILSK